MRHGQRRSLLLLLAALLACLSAAQDRDWGRSRGVDPDRGAEGTGEGPRGLKHGTLATEKSLPRSSGDGLEPSASRALATGAPDLFIRTGTSHPCDEEWTSWPVYQEEGLATDNVLLFRVFNSVGNLFIVLDQVLQLARLLEVAIVLDCSKFPGFRVAFDPAQIKWDVDPAGIMEKVESAAVEDENANFHKHVLRYRDGVLLISDSRLLLLATRLNVLGKTIPETAAAVRGADFINLRNLAPNVIARGGASRPDPCAWNMFLRRSPSMMQSMVAQSPWIVPDGMPPDAAAAAVDPTTYVAWHVRTSSGETSQSFNATRHRYVFHDQRAEDVFPPFLTATVGGEDHCPSVFPGGGHDLPIYISSNSKEMARNCSVSVAKHGVLPGLIDLGVGDDGHTAYSKNPSAAAVSAFIDYLYLMDADIVVRSGSSFSGTVVRIKRMTCIRDPGVQPMLPKSHSGLFVCLPPSCAPPAAGP